MILAEILPIWSKADPQMPGKIVVALAEMVVLAEIVIVEVVIKVLNKTCFYIFFQLLLAVPMSLFSYCIKTALSALLYIKILLYHIVWKQFEKVRVSLFGKPCSFVFFYEQLYFDFRYNFTFYFLDDVLCSESLTLQAKKCVGNEGMLCPGL